MRFRQLFTPGSAHFSYIIGSNRQCLVVDPVREVQQYLDIAEAWETPITGILETHLHADYISGHLELADIAGAPIYISGKADCLFPHQSLKDEEQISCDTLQVKILETPGHTPESSIFVVTDLSQSQDPLFVLTGDTLLVGTVGSPDLVPWIKEQMAEKLYDSIEKIKSLGDHLLVYPCHGVGIFGQSRLSDRRSSTLGTEKRCNPFLQYTNKQDFTKALLADLPDFPDHFRRCSDLNRQGPPLVKTLPKIRAYSVGEFAHLAGTGHLVIDLRKPEIFAAAHLPHSFSIFPGEYFASLAAWIVSPSQPLLLVADNKKDLDPALTELHRVGLDKISGYLDGGIKAWQSSGFPTSQINTIAQENARSLLEENKAIPVDVSLQSFANNKIAGSLHVPVTSISLLSGELPREQPLLIFAQAANQAMLAATLLARKGFTNVICITG